MTLYTKTIRSLFSLTTVFTLALLAAVPNPAKASAIDDIGFSDLLDGSGEATALVFGTKCICTYEKKVTGCYRGKPTYKINNTDKKKQRNSFSAFTSHSKPTCDDIETYKSNDKVYYCGKYHTKYTGLSCVKA